mgnify:CR=1 FL=1
MFILIVSISCSEQGKTNYPENETKNETKTEDKIDNEASAAWDLNFAAPKIDIPYQVPEFTPSAGRYEVNEDLSDLFNAGQYEGFTKEQKNAIYEDGFVIMEPSYSVLKMHQIYEWPVYKESPVFITSDSALHLYHIYYDKSLSYVESAVLYDRLDSLSQKLFLESIKNYGNMDYSGLSEELKFVSAYFLTACRILGSNIESIDVPEEISSIADKEVKLIEESSDFAKSPLLRTDLDYSQFTVRGHYTGSEKLEKYFKAMMWYGLCGFPVFDETKPEPELNIDSLTKGMIITCMVLRDEDNFKSHENIYSITSMYTGLSDDLGILEIRELITSVYGKNPDFNTFKDSSYYPELLKEALKLPEPKIKPKTTEVNLPSGRQFRFMGQRFSYDAEIMQNLMEPYLRPIPSGLDVIAAFGSARAEELLDTYYKPKEEWDGYEKMLNKQREENKSISDDEWKADLYKGWLWSIKEPTVEVYAKLKWLAQNTKAQLKERNLLDEGNAQILDSIIDMQDTLMNISVKELTNQNITEEENIKLYHYGGRIDSIIQNLNRSLKEEGIGTEFDVTSALIADVATVAPNANFPKGTYLEVGNGLPLEIYAVCETNGKTYLAKGALFNYYEFMSDKRLTDGEWQEMMGIRKVKWFFDSEKNQYIKDENGTMNNGTNDDYFEEVELSRPLTGTVSKPLWTDSFITAGENHVISVEDMGLEWWQ